MMKHKLLGLIFVVLFLLITAKAALGQLDILESSVEVTVNGQAASMAAPVTVSPGDQVTIRFGFQNNYTDRNLGHVVTRADGPVDADENELFDGFPIERRCVGTDCNGGVWSLNPGETGSDSFSFNIPSDFDPTIIGFFVGLGVTYDNSWQDNASDAVLIEFAVTRDDANIEISQATLSDSSLSCSSSTTLTVELINRGELPLMPELQIYDQAAVLSSLVRSGSRAGEFSSFAATPIIREERTLDMMDPFDDSTRRITRTIDISTASLSTGNHRLYLYLVSPYFNSSSFFVGDTAEVPFTTSNCMSSFTPSSTSLSLRAGVAQTFTVGVQEAADLRWFVDNVEEATGTSFTRTFNDVGQHTVAVRTSVNQGEQHQWTVTVSNRPATSAFQLPNFDETRDMSAYTGLTVQNTAGTISFGDPVNLISGSGLVNLDSVMTILADKVAVDTTAAAGFSGRRATVTLARGFTNPIIVVSDSYNSGTFTECTAPRCDIVSQTATQFVFRVSGFSTYQVAENTAPVFDVSDILFDNVNAGTTVNTTITIRNTGSFESLTSVRAELVGVATNYAAQLTTTSLPSTLSAGQQGTVSLQINVPTSESSGRHAIGSLRITGTNENGEIVTALEQINLNPKSFLTIKSFKVNDKATGDLKLNEINEIKVEVQNDYTEDMQDIEVTVRILNVNDDDMKEVSEKFDLKEGKEDSVTLQFDLSGENIDEEQLNIEIEVEGTADDDTEHQASQTETVDIEREDHQVTITRAVLSNPTLSCVRQTTLQVTVENTGKSNEDEVAVKVKNAVLGIDENKENIKLDKYSDSDNDQRLSFPLSIGNVPAGNYILTVELYLDGDLEETKETTLTLQSCTQPGEQTRTTQTGAQLTGEELAQELQQQLEAARSQDDSTTINASFRQGQTYVALLGTLVVLVLIAVAMAIVVLLKRRR